MTSKSTRRVLQAVARDHLPEDVNLLPGILAQIEKGNRSEMKPHTKWMAAVVILMLALVVVLITVPGAANAMRHLFGYIPGVGLVEQSSPLRVLAEPVTETRQGISVSVTAAILSGDRTHLEYRIFGVPGSAYPTREDVTGCLTPGYLRLPDGTQLTGTGSDFAPIPAGVDSATFVMPCILDTLPGKAPEDWELPLHFVPAPPDLTLMPVIELSPQAVPTTSPSPTLPVEPVQEAGVPPTQISLPPTPSNGSAVTVTKEIDTPEGYILVGQFRPPDQSSEQIQPTGGAEIRDANGKQVLYTYPNDFNMDPDDNWAVQFKAAGLAYPLTITFPGVTIRPSDPSATAEFTFDAGADPQMGQEWKPDQEIQLAGHSLKLLTISADSRGGYSFRFKTGPDVYDLSLEIVGYTPTGWGGGIGFNGILDRSLSYARVPTGVLRVKLSNLLVVGEHLTWQTQWTPAVPRTDLPANPTPQPGVCLTDGTLDQLVPPPASLAQGKVLFYEPVSDDQWGLVVYNLDSSQKQVVTSSGNWGALSPDGSQVAYSGLDNSLHIFNLNSQTDQVLPNAPGFDLRWSPDGKQIAFVYLGGGIIDSVFAINADGSGLRQVSELSYETVIGWSPDGAQVYLAAPYTGGAAWKIYSFDLASGVTKELFTLENGTPKFLDPSLSPDGQWIAYRGRDNSSAYLVRTDGSDLHLVMDTIGIARIVWSSSGWLGVSLMENNSTNQASLVLRLDTCEAFRLPGFQGELEGLYIP